MKHPTRWQQERLIEAVEFAKDAAGTYAPTDWTLNQLLGAALRLAHTVEIAEDEDE